MRRKYWRRSSRAGPASPGRPGPRSVPQVPARSSNHPPAVSVWNLQHAVLKRRPKEERGNILRVEVVQVPEHIPQVPYPSQLLRTGWRGFTRFKLRGKFPAAKIGLAVKLSPPDSPFDNILKLSGVVTVRRLVRDVKVGVNDIAHIP